MSVPTLELGTIPRQASTKPQYLITFAVIGFVTPLLTLYLEQRGFTLQETGYVWGLSALTTILTPILITLLADTAIAGKYIMAALFALSGMALVMLVPAYGFWPVVILYTLHSLIIRPVFPLQDGIHFAAQAQRVSAGLPEVPYHAVRVWGSVGYVIPCIILFFFLGRDTPMTVTMYGGIACCLIGTIYALFFLPYTPAPPRSESHSRLPTLAAVRTLAEPHTLIFCAAMFLVQASSAAYYSTYPVQLVNRGGLDPKWVGPIISAGVALETLYILSFGRMVKWMTLRRIMYIGALAIAVRMFVLAATPNAAVAIATQLLHGLTVLTVHVAPPIFLNAKAGDEYRNSIQGLYSMVVVGPGQLAGFLLTGYLSAHSLALTFNTAGVLGMLAMFLFYFAFHEKRRPAQSASSRTYDAPSKLGG